MSPDSVGSLADALRKHRLLALDQLDELTRSFLPRFSDARGLAKYLVQRGWLTVYQVNQVLQGRAAELVLGPYHIQDRLGQGGVSQVFKAWDTKRNHVVALKRILPDLLTNREAVGRFEREMRVVAHLDHPNIVRAFDASVVGA